jgi:dTDP-4-dehydrorhamnose reductase
MFEQHSSTILVTGANGQLGKEIQTLSNKFPSYRFLFTSKEELPINDTALLKSFFNENQINFCINCAAYTAVDKAESESEKAFEINATAVEELAKLCDEHHVQLIHISTDYVYNGDVETPLKESDSVGPINVYGASKLKGEELALAANPSSIIIRTSWVYSSFGNNFVKTMLRLLSEKEEINVINDQLGSPTYAADLANVIMQLIQQLQQGKSFSGIVNYCNDGVTSWYDFANEIKTFIKSDCKINPIPTSEYKTAAQRPLYSVLDTSKIRKWLQLDVPSWKDSLQKCIAIFKAE